MVLRVQGGALKRQDAWLLCQPVHRVPIVVPSLVQVGDKGGVRAVHTFALPLPTFIKPVVIRPHSYISINYLPFSLFPPLKVRSSFLKS